MRKAIVNFIINKFGYPRLINAIAREAGYPKEAVEKYIKNRLRNFFKQSAPNRFMYPYKVHSSLSIFGQSDQFPKLHMVGDNWIDSSEKPIAIVFGCSAWKFGILADYLPEFRVVFAPKKMNGRVAVKTLIKHKQKISQVIIWGYADSRSLSFYLRKGYKGSKVWRIDDGFIRSSELGVQHTTPYSLVIDKTGFYYNCSQSSDIEDILNLYDFNSNPDLMQRAEIALNKILELRLSKYNPALTKSVSSIKTRKRIAVLGQIDNDASIRFGNPDDWTFEALVDLARKENPGAEIIYRPHPEVFLKFQKSNFKKRRVESFAKVISPEENIIDFIERVDHVYTITSLSGMEALLRGKAVTVVGVPFYSGWGLTDDRVKIPRRKRSLSSLELFAGSYLLYPRYLANLEDPYVGLMAAAFRIQADKHETLDDAKKATLSRIKFKMSQLITTYKWPSLIFNIDTFKDEAFLLSVLREAPFDIYFKHSSGHLYPSFIAYLLVGKMPTEESRDQAITSIRKYLDHKVFNELLIDLEKNKPGTYLLKHWAWLSSQSYEQTTVIDFIDNEVCKLTEAANKEKVEGQGTPPDNTVDDVIFDILHSKMDLLIDTKDFSTAIRNMKALLLSGRGDYLKLLKGCISISELTFDFESASKLSLFLQGIDLAYGNKFGILSEFRASTFLDIHDLNGHAVLLAKLATLKPDKIYYVGTNLEQTKTTDCEPHIHEIIKSILNLDNDLNLSKVQGYLAFEQFNQAVRAIEHMIDIGQDSEAIVVHYSKALSFNGQLAKAKELIEQRIHTTGMTPRLVTEAMRLYVFTSDEKMSLDILNAALSRNIEIGEMHRRKCYLTNRMLYEGFKTFTELPVCKNVAAYYKDKYYAFEHPLDENTRVFLLAIFGPGDELCFSSNYGKVKELLGVKNVSIACSPRLHTLYQRSYPDIDFVPVPRPRNSDPIDLSDYTLVPGSDIMGVVNNTAVEEIEKSDKILFANDLLHRSLPDYDSFHGTPYLFADPERVEQMRIRFPASDNFLVGICWRSSVKSTARNVHYLSIEQLEPLFKIENTQFVNLQYDDCSDEIAWVNDRYPGKLIDFEDIDQFNDFESVAALMSCMDLIVAPASTTLELSAAIGCKTFYFSNSTEIDWRKTGNDGTDVWHNCVKIVDVENKGNKEALAQELERRIRKEVATSRGAVHLNGKF